MNGVIVEIEGVSHPMRWEVSPVHEFETLHPSMGGVARAWSNSTVDLNALFALWCMSLRCKDGQPKMTETTGLALLQAYLDEGHEIEDAYDLVGEAGVAGKFFKLTKPDAEDEVEASPLTPEDGTTAPSK